ncbi:4Fe-4S binding protein [Pseudotabrizicola sp. L79]|uniref:4Fe-4S binding protein n=1 Tax=Pseudotabrizicola sp. L79 TaxID=3118402 RepID=UPI002F928DA2
MRVLLLLLMILFLPLQLRADPLLREQIAPFVVPPYALGEALNDKGVWSLLNSGGAEAGYVFETEPMAPLPGFSGAPINILVMLDLQGTFIDVRLISHNEPIFVSGLGEAPFHKFFEQYRGHSINEPLVVGSPYGAAGAGSDLVYLDGVTKATASVRIAHESLLAATLQVAREKMQGISTAPPAFPNPEVSEDLSWADLVDQGMARNLQVTNAQVDAAFASTVWADDDPEATAAPDDLFLDLWVVDLGPPSLARAVLDDESFADLQRFMAVSASDEPLLVIDAGRHGLVSTEFVRNTAPDRLAAEQDGLPLQLRDADLLFTLKDDVPEGTAMILRTDRRLGFDPARDWVLSAQAVREHGMFQPEIGSAHFTLTAATPERFFLRPTVVEKLPPWKEAILNRLPDLLILSALLVVLLALLGPGQDWLAGLALFTPIRLALLAFVLGFVGWWGQGQLSIVTPLATLRTAIEGGSFAYLLYDPFSLLIWGATIVGFVLWGRGLFCGWLCPFGALQEFAHHLGRLLRLPEWTPSTLWDKRLKAVKYVLLAGMVGTVIFSPDHIDDVAEVEPFKTAITTFFLREWWFAAYALFWLGLGMVMFKGFCRYVCPLGALMAIGGVLRGRDWIARRKECGSPCQLCKVRCRYGAIEKSGKVAYSECFQCLDCVSIHNDTARCVPLILAAKGRTRLEAAE